MNSVSDLKMRKALTFRASSIGDCLMGKYLLENVHLQYPDARLGLLVASRGAMIRDLFAAYPWLDVIEANRRSPRALLSLGRRYAGSDLVVTQYAGKQGGRFALASKCVARLLAKRGGLAGFTDASTWNKLLYDVLVPVNNELAVAEHERAVLRAVGLSVQRDYPTMAYIEDDTVLGRYGLTDGQYCIVHLYSGSAKRGLSPEKKRELITALAKALPKTRLVVTGGAGDRDEALRLTAGTEALVCAGEVSLQQLMNLITHSRAVVSVDTGVAHLAAQLRRPLVVLRTCLAQNWWVSGQYGKDAPITVLDHDESCREGHTNRDYPQCLNSIHEGNVIQAV